MKTILITGTTSGIGKVTATRLAQRGHRIVMANRNADKSAQLASDISEQTGNSEVSVLPLDLVSLASVRDCAAQFSDQYGKLDLLINNAGMMTFDQVVTEDGLESQFCVNNLAQLLFTVELIPVLEAAAPAHVVFVTSMMHKMGKLVPDSYQGGGKYSGNAAYGQSKLAMTMNAKELSQRLGERGIAVNSLHPGAVDTGILDAYPRLAQKLIRLFFTSPEKGARTTLYLADMDPATCPTGKYFDGCKEARSHKLVDDTAARQALWQTSCELLGIGPDL